MAKTKLENDYERMVPEFHKGMLVYAEHMTRYVAAQELVAGKVVLDIASGSGYGTQLLAKKAKKVYGVDVDEQSVRYASENFGGRNIEYKVGNAESIPLGDQSVDVVVTFETIEHVKNYRKFIDEIRRILKPDGLAIISTPNDLEFAEGNHFHLHEFTYKELMELLRKDFKNIDSYFQATWKYVALADAATLNADEALAPVNYSPVKPEQYLYFYLLCSNRTITEKITPMAAVGEHYSDRQLAADRAELEATHQEAGAAKARAAELEVHAKAVTKQRDIAVQELAAIKESRSFKLARKLAQAKNAVTRGNKQ